MDGSVSDEQVHIWLQEIADNGWISLHFDNPSLGGEERAELSGGGYKRYKMTWSQPSNRAIWSLEDARFTGLVANKVTYFGVWDAATLKNSEGKPAIMRAYAELPEPRIVLNGKGIVLHARLLVVSFG